MQDRRDRPYKQNGHSYGLAPPTKRSKPNDFHHNVATAARESRSDFGRSPQRRKQERDYNPALEHIARLPDPKDCVSCKLGAAEVQTGLIGLLDQLAHEEIGQEGSEGIAHHARELHRLLSDRANKTLGKRTKQLNEQRPPTTRKVTVPAYVDRKLQLSKRLPPLPPITEPYIEEAVFTHSSANTLLNAKGLNPDAINYERLEFLGDAYIEAISTRLIFSHFPHIETSRQSHLREQLVKNETLSQFSIAYGLADRLKHGLHMGQSKGWMKVHADVFEAYVAGVIDSDPENGFETAETWLTELWAPQLLAHQERPIENPAARNTLNKLVLAKCSSLEYRPEKDMTMTDGVQTFYIGVYLTGWGYEDEWLGTGEGQNKSQACVFAAMDALTRSKDIVAKANAQKLAMYPPAPKEAVPEKVDGVEEHTSVVTEKADHAPASNGHINEKKDEETIEKPAPEDGLEKKEKKKRKKDSNVEEGSPEKKKKKKDRSADEGSPEEVKDKKREKNAEEYAERIKKKKSKKEN